MLLRANETITEKFSLRNPTTGTRLTAAAFSGIVARDPSGADISSQISPIADGVSAGVYSYSFTPLLEGTYFISVYESSTGQYIDSEFNVGGSITDRVWNLANQGQTVALGAGGGGVTFTGTITAAGVVQPNILVRVFAAQDPLSGGTDTNAVADLTQLIAQATTNAFGNLSLALSGGYYVLQYFVGTQANQTFIRWSVSQAVWVTSSTAIPTSSL